MLKKIALGLGAVFLGVNIANAVPLFDGELEVGVMKQKPKGWIQYKGDRVDLKDDLRFDDETKFFAKAKIEHPIPLLPNIYLQYIPMDFKGDTNKTFTFDNKTYSVNVHTEVQLDHYDIGFYYNVPMVSALTSGVFDAEVGLLLRIIDFEAKVSSPGQPTSSTSFTAPIPMLYGSVSITPIDLISVVVEGKGIKYSDNYYYDLLGEIRISPLNGIVMKPYISLGYKVERLRIDDVDDTYSDIRIKQPYLAIGVNF